MEKNKINKNIKNGCLNKNSLTPLFHDYWGWHGHNTMLKPCIGHMSMLTIQYSTKLKLQCIGIFVGIGNSHEVPPLSHSNYIPAPLKIKLFWHVNIIYIIY